MTTIKSRVLDEHLEAQIQTVDHLEYLDKILWSINKVHIEKVMEMRQTIELTLLNNPDSKNSVVSYLSKLSDKLQDIQKKGQENINQEIYKMAA